MIERIIAWSAKHRFLVLIGTVAAVAWALFALRSSPLDAIPDLSDTQVILLANWDRPPQIIEDQITYPVVSALLGAPKVKDIRAVTDYGSAFIYIVFDDGTDLYWARSRVSEYLSKVQNQLPEGAQVQLGPDATGVGWVYEYALDYDPAKLSIAEVRAFQDWKLKYALQSVKGVAEVAAIGGQVKQYQITVNPTALQGHGITLPEVIAAIRSNNQEAGARLLELGGREYMVTIRGYLRSLDDIRGTVIRTVNNVPITVGQVAVVGPGPDIRRGVAELNGKGEVAGGVIVMRQGENALAVIQRVKEKIATIQLPDGLSLIPTYDRSELIERSIETLQHKLIEEMVVVALVIIVFLVHLPSAAIPIVTLPIATVLSFIPLYYLGLSSNIMSLGGIAIAVGAMVDASIVMVENAHKRLAQWAAGNQSESREAILLRSITEVGRASFFSLMVIAIAFLPIFSLEGVEGRLFRPLAFTKNFAMFFGALLAISLVPALVMILLRLTRRDFRPRWLAWLYNRLVVGRIHPEADHPISRRLFRWYTPVLTKVLAHPVRTVVIAIGLFAVSMPVFWFLGKEFMPPLNEGALLYMPSTFPGISAGQAADLVGLQDRLIKQFPEVQSVFGKAGRAATATDPAPLSMMETTIVLKPQAQWRTVDRWYSKAIPDWLKGPFRYFWPETMSYDELIAKMNETLAIPGQVNSWTMPIKGRIDMLTTGVRTAVGVKLYGDDLKEIERLGQAIEEVVRPIPGTRSVYAERTVGGAFVNYRLRRDQLGKYGLSVEAVEAVLTSAIGGTSIGQTIEGRERYGIQVRYPRELRNDLDQFGRVLIPTPAGSQIPVAYVADLEIDTGPGMIRDENGRLAGYVFIDVGDRDLGSYVDDLKRQIQQKIAFPPGYYAAYSGQYEFMQRVAERMTWILPLTIGVIFLLIRLNTRSTVKTLIILLAVPFSLIGVAWIMLILGYNLSLGVWAGIIALLGVDAETGIFMLMYLDLAYEERRAQDRLRTEADLRQAIMEGAVQRIRPKLMTVLAAFMGLLPIMWSSSFEAGADVMKRVAAPMVGGILSSFAMELLVYPAVYYLWKRRRLTIEKPENDLLVGGASPAPK